MAETFDGNPVVDETIETGPTEVEQTPVSQSDSQQQVSQVEPDWKRAGFTSPEQMYAELRKHQSEADRLKLENQRLKTPVTTQPQPTNEQIIEEFVKDPAGFIAKQVQAQTAPVTASAMLMNYAQEGHPEVLKPEFKGKMKEYLERNPSIAMEPDGLDMLYLKVKQDFDSVRSSQAQAQVAQARQQAETTKRTDAFVEGSGQPQRTASPILKPGMTIAESEKALAAMGIGDLPEDPYA